MARSQRLVALSLLSIATAAACSSSSGGSTSTSPAEPSATPEPAAAEPAEPAAAVTPTNEAEAQMAFRDPEPLANVTPPTPEQARGLAAASNAFAFDIYDELRGKPGNFVLSPASISLAFAMTYAGAQGPTADEMRTTMRYGEVAGDIHEAAGRQLAAWNDPSRTTYELRVVNRLFGEQTYTFVQDFMVLTRDKYRAPFEAVDFVGAPAVQTARINGWVASQTNDRIEDLIPPDIITGDTRLVLVNAVYFLGKWRTEFETSATSDRFFHLLDGSQGGVPMMSQVHPHRYAEVGNVQVLEMPYRGDELAMIVVLPRDRAGLPALEASMNDRTLASWVGRLREQRVEVHLPKFEIRDSRIDLGEVLPAMGMRKAFNAREADFLGMARPPRPDDELYISAAFHEAFVKVDEEGTEAAAATAVVMATRGGRPPPEPPPVVFDADHPFLFLIRDTRSGTVLFIGRVVDPRGGSAS